MFTLWHAFKHGHVDRQTLVRKPTIIRSRMSRCLKLYASSSEPHEAKTAKDLLKHWHGLFAFLAYEGVEPATNAAERGLRPAVIWRKICFGHESDDGDLLSARSLTAERTCILRSKNAFQFPVSSIGAYRKNLSAPSLLPAYR
jgi:hypothetical protein